MFRVIAKMFLKQISWDISKDFHSSYWKNSEHCRKIRKRQIISQNNFRIRVIAEMFLEQISWDIFKRIAARIENKIIKKKKNLKNFRKFWKFQKTFRSNFQTNCRRNFCENLRRKSSKNSTKMVNSIFKTIARLFPKKLITKSKT